MTDKHTPGLLRVHATNADPNMGVVGEICIASETERSLSGVCYPFVALPFGDSPRRREMTQANARRLAAAWNACDGISTDALEASVVEALVAACRAALREEHKFSVALSETLRAAIALAEAHQ